MTKRKVEVSSTVQRAIKIVNFLNDSPGPQSITHISKELGFSTTIVHRMLTTLKLEGYVLQDTQSKNYGLGTMFLNYTNKILTEMPFASIINPELIKLRNETSETVGFYVPNGNIRICVMEHESLQEIRRTVGVGTQLPVYAGATGRVIVAFQPRRLQNKVLNLLPSEEEKNLLMEKMSETKKVGYSIGVSEISDNVSALSAPVFDQNKHIIGALSVSGPSFRFNKEVVDKYIPMLLQTTERITQSLK